MSIEVAPAQPDRASADAPTQTGLIAASELHPGDVLAGRFRIEKLLGMGGMGVVYRARDLSLDIDIALKLLRPELARKPEAFERFRQELLLARQVSSAHVVRIHDIAQHEGRWFISMDFVDGESLEHRLDTRGKLPLDEAVAVTRALLDGLSAAHARGVVHRDLKPANVLIDPQGRAVLTDFGVARSLGATGATNSGVIVGTPEYLSPEQARGDRIDGRSDLYAVGLILYEMLSGALPFAGGTPAETVIQRLVRPPPPLARQRPDLPHWLHAFSERLLKLNPSHRFANATEALRALDARRVPRPPLDRRVWLAAAAVLVAMLGGGLAWQRHPGWWRPESPAVPVVPQLAVLPLEIDGEEKELAPIARLAEEQLRQWLRSDATQAVAPRRRVLDALARAAPGLHGAALQRKADDVARAANATKLWSGALKRDGRMLVLRLTLRDTANAAAPPQLIEARGNDAPALLADAARAVAPLLARPRDANPAWKKDELAALGPALLALDQRDFAAAAASLAPAVATKPTDPLLALRLLEAQEGAQQDLPAQATRRAALAAFANDGSLSGRTLYARALSGSGDGDKAVAVLNEAFAAYPNDPEIVMLDAETLAANGEGKRALELLEARVKVDPQDARAWFQLGRNAIKQGQAQAAVDDYLVRALVLATRAGDARAQGDVRNALGFGYERLGQLDAAIEQYNAAAVLREQAGERKDLASTLRNLAVVQAVHGDRAAAEKTLDRAAALLEALGNRASLADLYTDRGLVAEEHGDFAAALAAYREALAIRQQLDLPDAIAQSLNNVGFANFQLGAFDDALVYWQQAQAAYEKREDSVGALRVRQSIGLLEIARGHFDVARQRLEESLRTAQDQQLPEELAVAHTYLGELALTEGRYADAYASADAAAQAFARRNDRRGRDESALLRARVSLALGNRAAADAVLGAFKPEELSTEQGVMLSLAQAQRAALGGDRDKATQLLADATKAAVEAHNDTLAQEAGLARLRLALAANDLAQARELLPALRKAVQHAVPLKLTLLELETALALRGNTGTEAATRYREALNLLHGVERWRDAHFLHALGAEALQAGAEAEAARSAAAATRAQLLADAPADARAGLQQELDRRWREESGHESP
jgi:tetratricopeptide (TPR) repeat protein